MLLLFEHLNWVFFTLSSVLLARKQVETTVMYLWSRCRRGFLAGQMNKIRWCSLSNSKVISWIWSDSSSPLLAKNQGLKEECWPATYLESEILDLKSNFFLKIHSWNYFGWRMIAGQNRNFRECMIVLPHPHATQFKILDLSVRRQRCKRMFSGPPWTCPQNKEWPLQLSL